MNGKVQKMSGEDRMSTPITVQPSLAIERVLTIEIVRVTERAAVAAARLRGRGSENGPKVDIAVDPLEGTTLCAKNMQGAIAVMAMAEGGTLLNAPDVYMEKIAIGPGYAKGVVDLDATPEENIRALAKAKGVKAEEITVLVLDRPRHSELITAERKTEWRGRSSTSTVISSAFTPL